MRSRNQLAKSAVVRELAAGPAFAVVATVIPALAAIAVVVLVVEIGAVAWAVIGLGTVGDDRQGRSGAENADGRVAAAVAAFGIGVGGESEGQAKRQHHERNFMKTFHANPLQKVLRPLEM